MKVRNAAFASSLVFFMVLSGSATTCEQQKKIKTEQICGYVIDRNGARVPDAQVSAVDAQGAKKTVRTDSNGNFQIEELDRGDYEFMASYNGEVNARVPIELKASKKAGRCTKPLVVRLRFAGGCSGVSVEKDGARKPAD